MSRCGWVRMVKGPSSVSVRGRCALLGADVSGLVVRVRAGKALPFEPGRGCRLYAKLGRGARTWWADPSEAGTAMWKETTRAILQHARALSQLTVMVVGSSDTGKSTFCTYVANRAIAEAIPTCIVDGDIGQGDVAPPSAMGAAVMRAPVTDLRDTAPAAYEFVGAITPAGIEKHVAGCLQSLVGKSRSRCRLLLINTDGYVRDGGKHYKRLLADLVRPDVIVMLGNCPDLRAALAAGPWEVVATRASGEARKSYSERRWRRQDQFLRFVGHGHSRVQLQGKSFSYLGVRTGPAEFVSCQPGESSVENLFVGLGSPHEVRGFGLMEKTDGRNAEILGGPEEFDTVYVSNIRLGPWGAEQVTLKMPDRPSQAT